MSLKVNKNIPIHEQATRVNQEGLGNLQTPMKLTYPHFQCQTLITLQISCLRIQRCHTNDDIPNYSLKKEPILTAR